MNQIYHLMCSRQAELTQEIEYIQQLLSSMPDKFLICAKKWHSFKWYESDGHHCSYLPRKHRIRAEQLAKRRTSIVACSICKLKNGRSTRL